MACQLPLRRSIVARGHGYATKARSAWADLPFSRFLNEIGNDPAPAASLPSRLPFRSYICMPTRTAILVPSRQTPPFRTTATIFAVLGSRMTSWAKMKS